MSAFGARKWVLVSEVQVHAVLTGALALGVEFGDVGLDAVGQLLLDVCADSIAHDRGVPALGVHYRFQALGGDPRPLTVLKLLDGLTYQLGGSPVYRGVAAGPVAAIRTACLEHAGLTHTAARTNAHYAAAPWQTSDPDVFKALPGAAGRR